MSEKLEHIIQWMSNYKLKNNVKGVVLGLSGGKDSTVVAMLAKKVFGDYVLAVSMPSGEQKDISDVQTIIKTLNINAITVNIKNVFEQLLTDICVNITDKAKTHFLSLVQSSHFRSNHCSEINMLKRMGVFIYFLNVY